VTMRRKYRTELRHEHVQFRILLTNVNTTADSRLAESGSVPRSGVYHWLELKQPAAN
jgi:hypothetical protein